MVNKIIDWCIGIIIFGTLFLGSGFMKDFKKEMLLKVSHGLPSMERFQNKLSGKCFEWSGCVGGK